MFWQSRNSVEEKDLVNYPLDRQAQPYDKIVVTRIMRNSY